MPRGFAHGEQARDAGAARVVADASVARHGFAAELRHLAEHEPVLARQCAEHVDAGAHRARIRVVGIVDQPGAARSRLELQATRHGAHVLEAGDDRRQPDAGGMGRGGGAERVQHVVAAREPEPHARLLTRQRERELGDEGIAFDAALDVRCANLGGRVDAEADCVRAARHGAPEFVERIVGIDHGRARQRECREHLALRARHALEVAETLEMLVARIRHERDRRPGERGERRDLARMIRAHLDHRIAVPGLEPQERQRHADVIVQVAARRQRRSGNGEDCGKQFLGRRLAIAAADAEDEGLALTAPGAREGRQRGL